MSGLEAFCVSDFQMQMLLNHVTQKLIIYDFWLRHNTAVSFGRLGHWKNSQKSNLGKPTLMKISTALSKRDMRVQFFVQ